MRCILCEQELTIPETAKIIRHRQGVGLVLFPDGLVHQFKISKNETISEHMEETKL